MVLQRDPDFAHIQRQHPSPRAHLTPFVVLCRFGQLYFEETGQQVPYLIIPDTPEGRDPETIVGFISRWGMVARREHCRPELLAEVLHLWAGWAHC
jgi:hypothetical protein